MCATEDNSLLIVAALLALLGAAFMVISYRRQIGIESISDFLLGAVSVAVALLLVVFHFFLMSI